MTGYPTLRQVVLDAPDARALAEFYRELLGYQYRPGDEQPAPGADDPRGKDWLVLHPPRDADRGSGSVAIQQTTDHRPTDWGEDSPAAQRKMMHLDMTVADIDELARQRDRALALGARLRLDRSDDPDEPLYVFTDPAGHPFCIFV